MRRRQPTPEKKRRQLTGSEEDGGFGSLSGCDHDGDGLLGGRREVSTTVAQASEVNRRRLTDKRR
jgi:hypothetical protein